MKQDRMLRRGLAASAVSALTITGMTAIAPASRAADPTAVRLISQLDRVVTTRPDGAATAEVRLVAEGPEGWSVDFQVNADPRAGAGDPDWVRLDGAGVSRAGRYGWTSWAPGEDAPELLGRTVAIRAVFDNFIDPPRYSPARSVFIAPPHADAHRVHADFSGGYFVQPYASSGRTASLVGIAGTTSAADGAVSLEQWRPAAGAYRGITRAAVSPTDVKGHRGQEYFKAPAGEFDAVLPLSVFDAKEGDAVAVRTRRDTDDVVSGTVHRQTIARIQADSLPPLLAPRVSSRSSATRIASASGTTSAGTTVHVRVADDDGAPVAGAEVRRGDGVLLGYTDGAGQVTALQPNRTTRTYYVNTDDGDAYDPAIDLAVEYTSPAFTREPTELAAVLADGRAFDAHEYARGDVALQVVDQEGRPFRGARQVTYRLYPNGSTPPAPTTATTDASGRLVLPFDPSRAAGSWRLEHAISGPFPVYRWDRFVSGHAALALTPARGQAASGGALTFSGRLTVAGRALAGRTIDLAYRRGTEGAGGGADAGILVSGTRRLSATVRTRADGTFAVTVDDPRQKGAPAEQGGRLRATARTSGAAATAAAQFGAGRRTVRPVLRGTSRGGGADRLVVRTSAAAAGERVRILVKAGRRWKAVKTLVLGRRGAATVTVKDRNGAMVTTYRARLLPSDRVTGSRSATERVR